MFEIEMMLVEICTHRVVAFTQQDMKCEKCQRIKRDLLSKYCSCSGAWVYKDQQPEDLRKQLELVKRKAEFHGMKWLLEVLTSFGI